MDWLSIVAAGAVGLISSLVTTYVNGRLESGRIEQRMSADERRATADRIRKHNRRAVEDARDSMLAQIDWATAYWRGDRGREVAMGSTPGLLRYLAQETSATAVARAMTAFAEAVMTETPATPLPVEVLEGLGDARVVIATEMDRQLRRIAGGDEPQLIDDDTLQRVITQWAATVARLPARLGAIRQATAAAAAQSGAGEPLAEAAAGTLGGPG